jgi:1,4-alpha-glucan branching enzyme
MIKIVKQSRLLDSLYASLLNCDEINKCIVYERVGLIFIFNFHASGSIPGYEFSVNQPGDYKIILNTDSPRFGGHGRVNEDITYPTSWDESSQSNRLALYLTSRTAIVLQRQ